MIFIAYIRYELKVELVKEYKFHPTRRWRFDYATADPALKIAIEVEGAVWTNGRHTRGSGFIKDMEKYNTAASMGWTILRVTPDEKLAAKTVDLLRKTLESKKVM